MKKFNRWLRKYRKLGKVTVPCLNFILFTGMNDSERLARPGPARSRCGRPWKAHLKIWFSRPVQAQPIGFSPRLVYLLEFQAELGAANFADLTPAKFTLPFLKIKRFKLDPAQFLFLRNRSD